MHIGNILDDGENPIYKVSLQSENINGNLMTTTLFDDDTDIKTEDEEGTLVVATPVSTCQYKRQRQQYDNDMITRRVCAKRSNNEQIKAFISHVIAQ